MPRSPRIERPEMDKLGNPVEAFLTSLRGPFCYRLYHLIVMFRLDVCFCAFRRKIVSYLYVSPQNTVGASYLLV